VVSDGLSPGEGAARGAGVGGFLRYFLGMLLVAATMLIPFDAVRADMPVVIAVFGDSLADGLWGSLFRGWQNDRSVTVLRRARNGTGLAHPAKYDWLQGTAEIIATDKPDIAIITLGLNDRITIALPDKSLLFATDDWKKVYVDRVESLMGQLKKAGIPTFWIGLPVMRDAEAQKDALMFNEIFRAAAERNGVTFIPMWDVAGGGETYQAFGKDKSGRERQIRTEDGVHYTILGYDLLSDHLRDALAPAMAAVKSKAPRTLAVAAPQPHHD